MKVLAISSYAGLGGSELTFAAFLKHRPRDIRASALVIADGELPRLLANQGLSVAVATGYEGRPTTTRLARFTRSLLRVIERDRPDVIWSMGQKGALMATPAARLSGVPLVWHKVDFSWDRSLAVPVALAVDGVVAVSEAAAAALGPLRRRRVLGVVKPPVTLDPELAVMPNFDQPTIGTLGRLVPYKGHHQIIGAASLLLQDFPDLRVILAGSAAPEYPDYRARIEHQAAELGMADRVEMPGFAPAPEVLRRLTVFVNATHRDEEGFGLEGLSGAMLEASWVGLPVVATRGGGTAEGLVDGESGSLVDSSAPEELAAAIAPYLSDPELARRAGAAGRRLTREWCAPEKASERLFELIGSVALRSPGPR